MGGVIAIDTVMHGLEGITAVYYLPGPHPTLIETGPTSSLKHTLAGLEKAGVTDLEFIIVTHIHLDHAGAVGHLAEKFPTAQVIVREEGAPHLIDPSRLWASAARLYPDMEAIWGEMKPVPSSRLVSVGSDQTVADLGDARRLDAIYTPGHAKHHMALLDRKTGDCFVGDAIGVRLQEAGVIRPATPPPEFDLDVSLESIERIRSFRPARLFPTHYGAAEDSNAVLDEGSMRMNQWVEAAEPIVDRGGGVDEVAEEFMRRKDEFYPDLSPAVVEKLEGTTSYDLNARGIVRYLSKKKEAATL
jgi:glyoxylase-like metal-dependent hydrolase (beta-lactamase superfamily II)